MSNYGQPATGNSLLASLSPSDRELIAAKLEPVSLRLRQKLEIANREVHAVYFIETGLASVISMARKGRVAEVAIIGREGVTGAPLFLGINRSVNDVVVQIPGTARRINARDLRDAMSQSHSLATCFFKFIHVLMVQMGQTVVANAKGTIEERLARWLLMAHDRIRGDEVALTHDLLSIMLGVRRSGVTVGLQKLEEQNLVRTSRGRIVLVDFAGLAELAAGLYGVPEAEYERVFAPGVAVENQ